MEATYIVAIEVASSKIKGAVGSIGRDGRLAVLAAEEVPSAGNVRYGRVQNIREVSAAINDIIERLEEAPAIYPRRIEGLALSLGGRSLSGVPARAARKFPTECEITETQVQRLNFEARQDYVGDKIVEAVVPRKYFVNNNSMPQPVGTYGDSLRGEFVLITAGRETHNNLERLKIDNVATDNVRFAVRQTAIADLVLTSDEKELGVALVDFGAETTTVAAYKEGSLAFLCTLPMGSRLITLDLTVGLSTTEENAESIKRQLASQGDEADQLAKNYAHSRAGEIVANVLNQLELAGYPAGVMTKYVITGGGAKLPDFAEQMSSQSKQPVRIAEMPSDITFRVAGRNNSDNIDLVALLAAAARLFPDGCLSVEAKVVEEPVVMAEQEEIPEVKTTVVMEEETVRRDDFDEDSRLLDDDPDDDEEEHNGRRFSLFGRKKKNSEAKRRFEPEPEPEPETEPEPEPKPEDVNPDPDNFNKTRRGMQKLRDGLMKIFTPVEGTEYDDEE